MQPLPLYTSPPSSVPPQWFMVNHAATSTIHKSTFFSAATMVYGQPCSHFHYTQVHLLQCRHNGLWSTMQPLPLYTSPPSSVPPQWFMVNHAATSTIHKSTFFSAATMVYGQPCSHFHYTQVHLLQCRHNGLWSTMQPLPLYTSPPSSVPPQWFMVNHAATSTIHKSTFFSAATMVYGQPCSHFHYTQVHLLQCRHNGLWSTMQPLPLYTSPPSSVPPQWFMVNHAATSTIHKSTFFSAATMVYGQPCSHFHYTQVHLLQCRHNGLWSTMQPLPLYTSPPSSVPPQWFMVNHAATSTIHKSTFFSAATMVYGQPCSHFHYTQVHLLQCRHNGFISFNCEVDLSVVSITMILHTVSSDNISDRFGVHAVQCRAQHRPTRQD